MKTAARLSDLIRSQLYTRNLILFYLIYYLVISFSTTLPLYGDLKPVIIPSIFLIFRDFLFFGILGVHFLHSSNRRAIILTAIACFLLFLNTTYLSGVTYLTALGFRNLLPVFFLFSSKAEATNIEINWDKLVKILLVLNILLQVAHFFFGQGYYARVAMGLNARNPGLFFYPAASALFILVLFSIYLKINKPAGYFWPALFSLSIIFCASLTGMAGMIFLYFTRVIQISKTSFKYMLLLIVMIFAGFSFLHLARTSMNGPIYYLESSTGRFKIFKSAIQNLTFWPENFGRYTNLAAKNEGVGFVPDSFYTSFLANLGGFWSVALTCLFCFLLFKARKNRSYNMDFIVLFLICGISLNVPETGISMFLLIILKNHNFESPVLVQS